MSLRAVLPLLVAVAVFGGGCGGGAIVDPATPAGEAPVPPPRDAALIAQALCGGKVGVMVYNERVRESPIAPKLAAVDVWSAVLEGTGIDPVKDLDRAFVTAPSARAGERGVAVAEHHVDADKIKAAIEVLIGRSSPPGSWIEGIGVPAARVTVRGLARAVVVPRDGMLVVLPEALAPQAVRFAKSGGFPDPVGPEAAVASAVDPHETLRGPRVPAIPPTVQQATAHVVLKANGGAEVKLDAVSSSAEQAEADAAELTRSIDAATTVKIAFIKVRFFDPIVMRADGDRVKGELDLAPADVDKLLGLARALVPP